MADVQEYIGKKVDLILNDDGEQAELTGTIESANSLGFVFKPARSPKVALYEVAQIENISLAPEREPELKARRLDPVSLTGVKRHLVDRHGYPLEDINAMSAEDAFDFHNVQVDHGPLSHYHAPKPEKKADESAPTDEQEALDYDTEDDDDDEIDF